MWGQQILHVMDLKLWDAEMLICKYAYGHINPGGTFDTANGISIGYIDEDFIII